MFENTILDYSVVGSSFHFLQRKSSFLLAANLSLYILAHMIVKARWRIPFVLTKNINAAKFRFIFFSKAYCIFLIRLAILLIVFVTEIDYCFLFFQQKKPEQAQ